MASKTAQSCAALFLCLNLLFFTTVSACGSCRVPVKPPPKPKVKTPAPCTPPYRRTPTPTPTPTTPTPTPPTPTPTTPTPTPMPKAKCPTDTVKLGACANVLGVLPIGVVKSPEPCCSLVGGLVDLEAALCLCTVLKLGVLGLISPITVPIDVTLLLDACGKRAPAGFMCP